MPRLYSFEKLKDQIEFAIFRDESLHVK